MTAFHQDGKELDIVLTADTASGLLVQYAGVVCLVNPNPEGGDWKTGDTGSVRRNCVVRIPNPDAVTFSDGDTVGYDQVNDKVTAAAGGTFDCGTAVGPNTGTDPVIVLI